MARTKAAHKTDAALRTDFRLITHFHQYFVVPRLSELRAAWNTMVRFKLEDEDFHGLVPEEFFATNSDGRRVLDWRANPDVNASVQGRFGFLVGMLSTPERASRAGPLYLALREAGRFSTQKGDAREVAFGRTCENATVVLPDGTRMTLKWLGSLWDYDENSTTHIDQRFAGHPTILKLAAFNRERIAHRHNFDAASRFLQEEMTDTRYGARSVISNSVFSMCSAYPDMRETFKLVFGDMESPNKKTTAAEQLYPKRGADNYSIRHSGGQHLDSAGKRAAWVDTRDVLMRATLALRTPEKDLLPGEAEFFKSMNNA